jgi:hypothetical protein
MTFKVGRAPKEVSAYRNLLYKKIPSLASVNEEHETRDMPVPLPDVDVVTFSLLLDWVYNPMWAETLNPKTSQEISYLLKLYCLGEKYHAEELLDVVIDAIEYGCATKRLVPTLDEVLYCYEHTEDTSPLRQLIVSLLSKQLTDSNELEELEKISNDKAVSKALSTSDDLVADFVKSVRSEKQVSLVSAADRCKYHVHGKDRKEWYCDGKKYLHLWGVPREVDRVDRAQLMEWSPPLEKIEKPEDSSW